MNKHLVAAALLCSLLASCTTMIQGGEDDYSYVLDAKRLGNQAVDQVMAGQGEPARSYFQQSTDVLARGVVEHSRRMAERADTMSTFADIGTVALTVAGAAIGMEESPDSVGTQQFDSYMNQLSNLLLDFNNAMQYEIRSSEHEARYGQQRKVDQDRWRSVVVSDRNLARSIVRVRNHTNNHTKNATCSGAFIAPHVVLSAAHCFNAGDVISVYRHDTTNGKSFITGDYEDEIPTYDTVLRGSWEDAASPYSPSPIAAVDWLLIVTREPSQHYLPVTSRPVQPGEKLMALGYSGDLNGGYFLQIDYGCEVKGTLVSGMIESNCVTYAGNSGGPVLTANGNIAVIGVHSRGNRHGDRAGQVGLEAPMNYVAEGFAHLMKIPQYQNIITTNPFASPVGQQL
ncbi:trypsin-like serine peptidase [Halomonas cupida]|uniref:trypsin-like serine peptidase n=1 Tax=Halomonas cupida TaxID=44933 RepID=UPI003A944BBC